MAELIAIGSTENMKTLTDEDVDGIVHRLLEALGQQLSARVVLPVTAPVPARSEAIGEKLPQKLAYTLKELSAELGVSRVTLYRLIMRGLLKPLPYLRTKVFARTEVERFLSAGTDWNSANRPGGRRARSSTIK